MNWVDFQAYFTIGKLSRVNSKTKSVYNRENNKYRNAGFMGLLQMGMEKKESISSQMYITKGQREIAKTLTKSDKILILGKKNSFDNDQRLKQRLGNTVECKPPSLEMDNNWQC